MNKENILRKLIREHLASLFEGGHRGVIRYGQAEELFKLLDKYSASRKFSPPTIDMMDRFLVALKGICKTYSEILGAYSHESDSTSPIYNATMILDKANKVDPRIIMQHGGKVDILETERQFFQHLGAGFNVPNNPASGFENMFKAGLDWQGVDREVPAPQRSGIVGKKL